MSTPGIPPKNFSWHAVPPWSPKGDKKPITPEMIRKDLFVAIDFEDVAAVVSLLALKASPDMEDEGMTALAVAKDVGNVRIIALLEGKKSSAAPREEEKVDDVAAQIIPSTSKIEQIEGCANPLGNPTLYPVIGRNIHRAKPMVRTVSGLELPPTSPRHKKTGPSSSWWSSVGPEIRAALSPVPRDAASDGLRSSSRTSGDGIASPAPMGSPTSTVKAFMPVPPADLAQEQRATLEKLVLVTSESTSSQEG